MPNVQSVAWPESRGREVCTLAFFAVVMLHLQTVACCRFNLQGVKMPLSAFLVLAIVAFVIIVSGTLFTTGAKPVEGIASGVPLPIATSSGGTIGPSGSVIVVGAVSDNAANSPFSNALQCNTLSGAVGVPAVASFGKSQSGYEQIQTNFEVSALASASRAPGATNSLAQTFNNAGGVIVFVDVTNVGAAGTVTVKLQHQDPVSGNWVDIPGATTAAIAAISTVALIVFPGVTVVANQAVSQRPGRVVRVVATVATNNVTFSVGLSGVV